jgi:hypothetical protein
MTDWGARHNDIAQWGNGTERSGPVEINGKSLREMIKGGYNAASRYRVKGRTTTPGSPEPRDGT